MTIDTSKEAVERLLDGVTPGPWMREAQSIYHSGGYGLVAHLKAHEWRRDWPTLKRDGDFIAAARKLVPALSAERDAQTARADAAEADVARLTAALDKVSNDLMHADMRRITAEAELTALRAGQDALVAAVYADAGAVASDRCAACGSREIASLVKEHVIRRMPSDATAALVAKLRAERNKALREAAAAVEELCPHADIPGGNCIPDKFDEGTSAAYETILAMIEPEGK